MNYDERTKIIVEKLILMENSLKEERFLRLKLEEENNRLNEIINTFSVQIEEKENSFRNLYIDKLNIEKLLYQKSGKPIGDDIFKNALFKNQLPSRNSENNYIFYKNLYETEKKKHLALQEELAQLKKNFEASLQTERHKCDSLNEQIAELEKSLTKSNNQIKSLSESNKNLLVEINTINNILDSSIKQKEILSIEHSFYKSELETIKNYYRDAHEQMKKLDKQNSTLSKQLNEFISNMSDNKIMNKIYSVTRIGRVYESATDIVFTQDDSRNYMVLLKYLTSTDQYKIHEIEDFEMVNGEEYIFIIKFPVVMDKRAEKFKTIDAKEIVKTFKELKLRIGENHKTDSNDEVKMNNVKENVIMVLQDMF